MDQFSQITDSAVAIIKERLLKDNCPAPEFFLQFGPGFSIDDLFDQTPAEIFLHHIPGLPADPTPDNVLPRLVYGKCHNVPILVACGHRHMGEGFGVTPCILPLTAAWKLGAKHHIFVDSGVSLRQELKLGRWMVLTDYINGYAISPTDGKHDLFTTTYPDMSSTFSQHQNSELINALSSTGITPRMGIFMGRPGFHTNTMAETSIARNSGADMVGHDLVLEAMFSHALGVQVSAFALAIDQWTEGHSHKTSRADALNTCQLCSSDLMRGLAIGIEEISKPLQSHTPLPNACADEILSQPLIPKEQRRSPLRAFLPKDL